MFNLGAMADLGKQAEELKGKTAEVLAEFRGRLDRLESNQGLILDHQTEILSQLNEINAHLKGEK